MNDEINDQAVSSFGEVLIAKKDIIKEFSRCKCIGITAAGLAALTVACLTPMPNLRERHMGQAHFHDDVLHRLSSGLHSKPYLKTLSLGNANITMTGSGRQSRRVCVTLQVYGKFENPITQFTRSKFIIQTLVLRTSRHC